MSLRAKLVAALARSTSQNPVSTEALAQGHSLRSVKALLMAMYQAREVCCCTFFKGTAKPAVKWWVPGNIENANYNQTLRANKRAKAAAAMVEVGDE
jgi:hypothetical protein